MAITLASSAVAWSAASAVDAIPASDQHHLTLLPIRRPHAPHRQPSILTNCLDQIRMEGVVPVWYQETRLMMCRAREPSLRIGADAHDVIPGADHILRLGFD